MAGETLRVLETLRVFPTEKDTNIHANQDIHHRGTRLRGLR